MEQIQPVRLQFTYTHIKNANQEQIHRIEMRSEDVPLKPGDTRAISEEYPFGYLLSMVMKCIPVIKRNPPSATVEINDIEAIIVGIRHSLFLSSERDTLLFDFFLADLLWMLYFMNDSWLWILLQNLDSFLEICSTDNQFCTIEKLATIASQLMIPLSAGERLIRPEGMKGVNYNVLSPKKIKKLLVRETAPCFNSHNVKNLAHISIASLYEIFSEERIVKKCKNCNSFFVPLNRSDTIYCDAAAPQDTSKTCKEYGKYVTYLKKTQTDEATKLYKQIYNAKANRVKRCDNKKMKDELEDFILQARKWKEAVKSDRNSEADYVQWLKDVKGKKVDGWQP